jgi:hypothetical protein
MQSYAKLLKQQKINKNEIHPTFHIYLKLPIMQ